MNGTRLERAPAWLPLALALLLSGLVQAPILDSFFVDDDYQHLYWFAVDSLPEFLARTFAGHALAAWRGVFWLYASFFGLEARLWFAAGLATHLVNVGLLYGIVRRLGGKSELAGLASSLWGTSPAARASIAWVSTYGNVLMATWVLWALYEVAGALRASKPPGWPALLRWSLLMLLAANSFGIGIGVAMAFPFACWLLLRGSPADTPRVGWLFALVVVVPLVYWAVVSIAWEMPRGAILNDPFQKLSWQIVPASAFITASFVAYAYATVVTGPLLLVPVAELGFKAAFAGALTAPLTGTIATLLAIGAALRLRKLGAPARRRVLALLLLVASSYAMVAIGRAEMQSLWGNVLWMMPRYHYLGPALAWATIACLLADRPYGPRLRVAFLLVAVVVALWSASSAGRFTRQPAPGIPRTVEQTRAAIEKAVAATPTGGTTWILNRRLGAQAHDVFPLGATGLFRMDRATLFRVMQRGDTLEGRSVRFVERDPEALRRMEGSARMQSLLVAPAELPEGARVDDWN